MEILDQKSEVDMSMIEMVNYHNYPVEHAYVKTEDGYLLDIYHITGPRYEELNEVNPNLRRPILLVHGILQSSFRFVINGPGIEEHKAPAYQLADTGLYDVWLLNVRGNALSREHSFMDADSSPEFWDFTFEQFGEIDIPTAIEYILKVNTGYEKVAIISYSQGTTSTLYGMS